MVFSELEWASLKLFIDTVICFMMDDFYFEFFWGGFDKKGRSEILNDKISDSNHYHNQVT